MRGRGTYIDLKADDGGVFRGYLSVPQGEAGQKGPALVLLQEIFGVNDNMRQIADMFADQGYISIVPDLFWRKEPGIDLPYSDLEKARAIGLSLDVDLAVKDILATARYMKTRADVRGQAQISCESKMRGRGTYIDLQADNFEMFRGYLSIPQGEATQKGPGLVLLHEAFGVNDNMRQLADMFADEGYITIIPDLFWRTKPGVEFLYSELEKARAISSSLDTDLAVKDILATVRHLKTLPNVHGQVGTIGFCLGGRLAFLSAARGADQIACAISYYGVKLDLSISEAPNVKCPIMFHFGGQDPVIPPNVVKIVEEAFKDKDDAEVFVYPEAGHGFGSPFRTDGHYQKEPAELALKRTLALLTKTLKD